MTISVGFYHRRFRNIIIDGNARLNPFKGANMETFARTRRMEPPHNLSHVYASLAFGTTESLDLEREYLISALIYGDLDANGLCGL